MCFGDLSIILSANSLLTIRHLPSTSIWNYIHVYGVIYIYIATFHLHIYSFAVKADSQTYLYVYDFLTVRRLSCRTSQTSAAPPDWPKTQKTPIPSQEYRAFIKRIQRLSNQTRSLSLRKHINSLNHAYGGNKYTRKSQANYLICKSYFFIIFNTSNMLSVDLEKLIDLEEAFVSPKDAELH